MTSLFGSTITTADIEGALQNAFGTKAKFKEAVGFEDLGGTQSHTVCLMVSWTLPDSSLPTKFVVKFSGPHREIDSNPLTSLAQETMNREREETLVKRQNNEIAILTRLKETSPNVKVPEILGYKKRENCEDSGYILLKYYESSPNIAEDFSLPISEVKQIIEQAVEIHKAGTLFSDDERKELNQAPLQNLWILEPKPARYALESIRNFCGPDLFAYVDSLERILDEMLDRKYIQFIDETCEHLGIQRLLCHGDMWLGNMLWKRTEDKGINLQAVVDLEAVHFGCPLVDLVKILTCLLSSEGRRKNSKLLVEYWWECLGSERPYKLEQAFEAYERVFSIYAFNEAGCLASTAEWWMDKMPDKDNKTRLRQIILEKITGLVEDAVVFHKRNMTIFKSLS